MNEKRTVDHYLKPKKKKYLKAFLIFIALAIVSVLVYVGANAYGAFSKIIDDNDSSLFDKLQSTDPNMLNGEGDGRVNILLLGVGGENHPGGTLTDTIQVLSIDPVNNQAATLSIPRDLYVEIEGYGGTKINQVYYIGENYPEIAESGAKLMKDTVGEILDLPIHYYVKLDFDGFIKIVDEVGGLDINVETAISDPYYPAEDMIGYNPFYISAGEQHLNGNTALKYARSRETTSDFDRSARQQQIMLAFKDKILSLGFLTNPAKISGMLQILGDHLRTDIQLDEMKRMVELAQSIDTSNIASRVLDNSADGPLKSFSNGGYYLTTKTGDWSEVQSIAHEIFTDPYLEQENASIEVLNGTDTVGTAKNISDSLTSYGYNIVNLDTSEKHYTKTTIYDYSNGAYPYTIKFLSERYDAEVIEQPTNDKTGIDLTLIIGDDNL